MPDPFSPYIKWRRRKRSGYETTVQWCEEYKAHSLHSLFVCCRVEDLTHPEEIRQSAKCDRTVALYGYVRGIPLLPNSPFHMPGCGDFHIHDLSMLPDPCPLPDKQKRRSLNEKEKMIYAPMSGMGGIVYDKDAMYIDLGGSHHGVRSEGEGEGDQPHELVSSMMSAQHTIDRKMASSELTLLKVSRHYLPVLQYSLCVTMFACVLMHV